MIYGMHETPEWCVDNWATQLAVRFTYYFSVHVKSVLEHCFLLSARVYARSAFVPALRIMTCLVL